MADLDKVTLPSGSTYNLKDTQARQDIETLKATAVGAVHYLGVTTTALSDGSETNPITIGESTVTAKNGDFVIYGKLELVFSSSDNKWHEYGSTGSLKALAFKDSATGKITPAGTVSQPTFTGNAGSISLSLKMIRFLMRIAILSWMRRVMLLLARLRHRLLLRKIVLLFGADGTRSMELECDNYGNNTETYNRYTTGDQCSYCSSLLMWRLRFRYYV